MSLLSFLSFQFGRNKPSAKVAKQRLQRVLAAERSPRSASRPDYFPALQRDLAGVVSKYVKVQPKGGRILTTQLYFPGDPGNARDGLFKKELLMRMASAQDGLSARFDFVLDIR